MPYLQTEHLTHDPTRLLQIKHRIFYLEFMTFLTVHCQHARMSILAISWQRRTMRVKCMVYDIFNGLQ